MPSKPLVWDKSDRECLVCGEEYTPSRRIQKFCPPPKTCRNTNKAAKIMQESGNLDNRDCVDCGKDFSPFARDQKRCGMQCPGKPDYTQVCKEESCGTAFTIAGNSRGKGNQSYCSKKCRDKSGARRNGARFRKYGLTEVEYLDMAETQEWHCAVCHQVPEKEKSTDKYALVVDHDHSTGAVRALLCSKCNKGEGLFDSSPERLRAMAAYIDYYNKLQGLA